MVRALERKLLRDVARRWGQVLTVALVVASGIAAFVVFRSAYESLERTLTTYYDAHRFGDVFASLRRAPRAVERRIEEIPGVARVYTRVVDRVRLPLEGEVQPPYAVLATIPADGRPPLNGVRLERGRMPGPGRPGEALLLARFAERRGIVPGDTLPAVIKGVRYRLRIVGLANSPEFIYPVPAGSASFDVDRTAVLWMERAGIEAALEVTGAFNDVVVALEPGADPAPVVAELDRVLEPYGGLGAVDRRLQASNYILAGELAQLRAYATTIPLIFLGVAAFLLNVVLGRLVELQRGQIATLKAIGYTDREIAAHYLAFAAVVVLLGAGIGVALGAWLGRELTGLYGRVFSIPALEYHLSVRVALSSVIASLVAASAGTLVTARAVMRLAPAEAMRPPAPAVYRPLLVERLGLQRLIAESWRMVLRDLERRPVRTLLSGVGVAVAMGTLVVGRSIWDSTTYLLDMQFEVAAREDLDVAFTQEVSADAVREIGALPGVLRAEGLRSVAVRVSAGPRHRDVPLVGRSRGAELRRIVDWRGHETVPDERGLVLTATLGEILGVRAGDSVDVRVMEGERREARLPIAAFAEELFGLQAYLPLEDLNRLLGEGPTVTAVQVRVDPAYDALVQARLGERPRVAAVSSRRAERALVEEQSAASQRVTMVVITLFAVAIVVGVVYNNARITVSTRSRELASLRVLGFTRAEISRILLAELGLQVLLALPLGIVAGHLFSRMVMSPVDAERFRWPLVITVETYAVAVAVVLAAATASALLVRRRLDRLDLIAVLKTRE